MINSLKIKIITLIVSILMVIFSMVAYVNFQSEKNMLHGMASRNTSVLIETIMSSIHNAMLAGHSEEISLIFGRIKSKELIRSLRIVSPSGKILNSADKGEIGMQLPDAERKESGKEGRTVLRFVQNEGVYDSYTRIYNTPQCHACHNPAQKVLGLLEIKLSLDYMNGFIAWERNSAVISNAVLIVLTFITIALFLTFYVDRPIKKLIDCMKRVEGGDFEQMAPIESSNEMRTLTTSFNVMVQRLKSLMESTVSRERDLARAQEKLSHHRETQMMNEKLEEQIREIENLNVSLEERIEEIEEANCRIVDMAGELEYKNTRLEKAVANLSTLYKVGLAINSTMEADKLFDLVVRTTMDTLDAEIGYISLYDQAENELRMQTLIGHTNSPPAGGRIGMKPSSISAWVVGNRRPLLIADMNDAPRFNRFSTLGYERKSLMSAPLLVKEEIIGVITMVNKRDDSTYRDEELELLCTIAAQAGIAIKNAKLYDDQQKTYLNTIQALVSAIEASDRYTLGHSERVTRYALALSRKLDLPESRLKVIERAAILHDIGKIGIDLSLLHKEGRLTPEDHHELQQHPLIGMRILEPIEFLHDVRLCIGQHHERYDGRGYPNNVAAGELLLESRILAIADSFDAMTSDRPYRKALPTEVAIRELRDNAGTQFDPELVPVFVELLCHDQGLFPGGQHLFPPAVAGGTARDGADTGSGILAGAMPAA
ncbi:MAG TPA: HD domain-containing phosphohydrolase [Geobacteraceae bacterium]